MKIKKITSKMYGKKNLKKVDDVRTEIFMEQYKAKTDGETLLVSKNLMPV